MAEDWLEAPGSQRTNRHAAAMDCEDAEEARDLLRHRNSNVTRAIYRAHFDDRRREALRARMEARMEAVMEAADGKTGLEGATPQLCKVLQIGVFGDTSQ